MRRALYPAIGLLLCTSCDDGGNPAEDMRRAARNTSDTPAPTGVVASMDGGAWIGPDVVPTSDTPPVVDVRPLARPEAVPTSWGGRVADLTDTIPQSAHALYLLAPLSNLSKDPEPINGIAADLDGDGAFEVVFATTLDHAGPRQSAVFEQVPGGAGLRFRGLFRTRSVSLRLSPSGFLDLDGDGRVDALLNRGRNELAWGTGGGNFDDAVPLQTGADPGMWVPPHYSMHVTDLDQDGWLDVITGAGSCCSTCRPMETYVCVGPRRYERRTDIIPLEFGSTAIAITDGILAGRRHVIMAGQGCGNSDVPMFFRQTALGPEGYPRFEGYDPTPREAYIRTSDPAWPKVAGSSIQRWVPMGVCLGDANNDLRPDLAVSLNFFTGLFVDEGAMPLRDLTEQFGAMPHLARSGRRMIPWGLSLVDLDRDGRDDMVVAHGNDHVAGIDPAAQIGPHRNVIEWNAGDGQFVEVTQALGADREGQYHGLYVEDLDRDGDADFLVGSLDDHPRVFSNRIDRGFHGFSLRLRGTSSNLLGIGALVRVEVTPGAPPREYQVAAIGSPGVVVDPTTFVGLGAATRAARVRVTWPSGVVQERTDVAAGTMHVWEEPALFTLEPRARHVAAGGSATLRITPRAPDGSVRPDARVSLTQGGATPVPLRAVGGGVWEATLAHPGRVGSTWLEITVDGAASGVRPRVWWD
ncbi:MAG: CRTAC1 family protein [Polyangiales bacterium]